MEINKLRNSFLAALEVYAQGIPTADSTQLADIGVSLSQIENKVHAILEDVKISFREKAPSGGVIFPGLEIKGSVEVRTPQIQYDLDPKIKVGDVWARLGDRTSLFFNQKLSVPSDIEKIVSEVATKAERKYLMGVLVQRPSKPRVSFKSK